MLLDDQVCRLAEAATDGFVDGRIGHGLMYVFLATVVAVVGCRCMARVDGEELALNVRAEVLDVVHAPDLRTLYAGEGLGLDAPLVKLFDLDVHARVGFLIRYDAVDGAVGEACSLVNVYFSAVVECLDDEALESIGGHDGVLAGDDDGWVVLLACIQALGDDWGDKFEHPRSDRAGDDIGGADLLDNLAFAVFGVDGAEVVNRTGVLPFWTNLGDGVFFNVLESLNQAVHNVYKYDFIIGLAMILVNSVLRE